MSKTHKCAACGTENDEDAVFCKKCGKKREVEPVQDAAEAVDGRAASTNEDFFSTWVKVAFRPAALYSTLVPRRRRLGPLAFTLVVGAVGAYVLGFFLQVFWLVVLVGAFLWARWIVAKAAGVPHAYIFFRRFEVPPQGVPRWARPAIAMAGLAAVYLVTAVFFSAAIKLRGEAFYDSSPIIDVFPGTPAELAGLRSGDRVLRVAGRPAFTFDDVLSLVHEHGQAGSIEMVVERDAAEVAVLVQPTMDTGVRKIGILRYARIKDIEIGTAIIRGLAYPAQFVGDIVRVLGGGGPIMRGPVPARRLSTDAYVYTLYILGYRSMFLGVLLVLLGLIGWRPRTPAG